MLKEPKIKKNEELFERSSSAIIKSMIDIGNEVQGIKMNNANKNVNNNDLDYFNNTNNTNNSNNSNNANILNKEKLNIDNDKVYNDNDKFLLVPTPMKRSDSNFEKTQKFYNSKPLNKYDKIQNEFIIQNSIYIKLLIIKLFII